MFYIVQKQMSTKKDCVATVEQNSQNVGRQLRSMKHKGKHAAGTSLQNTTHQCKYCKKSFSFLCRLKKHEASHTGERRHQCSECDKRFIRLSSLKEHMLTHTKEKPHKCVLCQGRFSLKRNLKRHLLTQH